MHQKHGVFNEVQKACCIRGYHAAVGELVMCKRELRNPVGTVTKESY